MLFLFDGTKIWIIEVSTFIIFTQHNNKTITRGKNELPIVKNKIPRMGNLNRKKDVLHHDRSQIKKKRDEKGNMRKN